MHYVLHYLGWMWHERTIAFFALIGCVTLLVEHAIHSVRHR